VTARTFDEFMRTRPAHEPSAAEVKQLRGLRQAEVSADRLTGDPDWDVYLSYLHAAIEATARQKSSLEERLHSPDLVDHVEMLKIKIALSECTARIDAWTAALNLPSDIKKNGRNAKNLIDLFGIEAT
jgi:hypothetical protein